MGRNGSSGHDARFIPWVALVPAMHGLLWVLVGLGVWGIEAEHLELAARTTHDHWHAARLVIWACLSVVAVHVLAFVLFRDHAFRRRLLALAVTVAGSVTIVVAAVIELAEHEALRRPGGSAVIYPSHKVGWAVPEALVSVAVAAIAAAVAPAQMQGPARFVMWLALVGACIGLVDLDVVGTDVISRFDRGGLVLPAFASALLVALVLESGTRASARRTAER